MQNNERIPISDLETPNLNPEKALKATDPDLAHVRGAIVLLMFFKMITWKLEKGMIHCF